MSAKYIMTNASAQTATDYMAAVDANAEVCFRTAAAFSPSQADIPGMTVRVEAGALLSGSTLTEVAAQNTGTISAPTVAARIDRVVISRATGAVSVITGVEAASPSAPALTADVLPVAQVALAVGQTSITDADITDERICGGSGDMLRANNLSDLMDVATARANLGLGTAALLDAGTTPPQFDNDTSLATTEFVQRALGNMSALHGLTVSQALDASHAGQMLVLGGAADTAFTLPSLAGLLGGTTYHMYNSTQYKVTITAPGADRIAWPTAAGGPASLTLLPGDSLSIVSAGAYWYPISGTAMLKMPTGPMGHSIGASGYQKLPGGLILQWGQATVIGGTPQTVTLPIAFPTQGYMALASCGSGVSDTPAGSGYLVSTSQVLLNHTSTSNARIVCYLAIGH